jgi:hypothetical protein
MPGEIECLRDGQVLAEYDELVAAEPGERVTGTRRRLETIGQIGQQLVAGSMTE